MAQVVECMLYKHKAMSSNPSPANKQINKRIGQWFLKHSLGTLTSWDD
jgi:hypothetical protein